MRVYEAVYPCKVFETQVIHTPGPVEVKYLEDSMGSCTLQVPKAYMVTLVPTLYAFPQNVLRF